MGHRARWIGWVALAAVLLPVGELPGYGVTRPPHQAVTVAQGQTAKARMAGADRLLGEALQLWRTSQFESAFNVWLQALELYRHPEVQAAFPEESRQGEGTTWIVSDGGTQMLMDAFYANLSQGLSKTEALQQAQIALIEGDFTASGVDRRASVDVISTQTGLPVGVADSLSHPYYWAPFILIGNGL